MFSEYSDFSTKEEDAKLECRPSLTLFLWTSSSSTIFLTIWLCIYNNVIRHCRFLLQGLHCRDRRDFSTLWVPVLAPSSWSSYLLPSILASLAILLLCETRNTVQNNKLTVAQYGRWMEKKIGRLCDRITSILWNNYPYMCVLRCNTTQWLCAKSHHHHEKFETKTARWPINLWPLICAQSILFQHKAWSACWEAHFKPKVRPFSVYISLTQKVNKHNMIVSVCATVVGLQATNSLERPQQKLYSKPRPRITNPLLYKDPISHVALSIHKDTILLHAQIVTATSMLATQHVLARHGTRGKIKLQSNCRNKIDFMLVPVAWCVSRCISDALLFLRHWVLLVQVWRGLKCLEFQACPSL